LTTSDKRIIVVKARILFSLSPLSLSLLVVFDSDPWDVIVWWLLVATSSVFFRNQKGREETSMRHFTSSGLK